RSCGFTLPACHLTMKFVKVVRWSSPIGGIGVVCECGWTKILMNVEKCLSGISSGDRAELTVDGTFLIPFENFASAWSLVVRYLTSAQAASRCLPPLSSEERRVGKE